MPHKNRPKTELDQPQNYQFRLTGYLDQRWADWFDGLNITSDEHGDTILRGEIKDQAELQGVLKKIYSIGLTLVSVNPVDGKREDV